MPHSSRPRRCAFTITEIMVVVGVIALLMGLLLPALRSVRASGRQTVELSTARQLMAAYASYANSNRTHVMPGYAPSDFKAFDMHGTPISGGVQLTTARRRYPWRIAPYLNYDMRGLFANEHRETLERLENENYTQYLYAVAQSPSLGINAQWVGGDYSGTGYAGNSQALTLFGKFYITSMSEALHPDRLIVFASARGEAPLTETGVVQGYFKVESPRFSYLDPAPRWSDSFQTAEPPANFGYVSPRHLGTAVIGFMDGHAGTLTTQQLTDMRHWANRADSPDWVIPQP
ncbi:MAG TPA: hypothetical protein PK098_08115 [Phycisphaerales bacterium]|nr:hypothetical protein [Phycisphaerales bacterium]